MILNKINKFFLFLTLLIAISIKADVNQGKTKSKSDSGNVINIETVNDFNSYLNKGPVVVDFHGESFCVPCKRMAPVFAKLSKKYPKVKFLKVDAQQLGDISKKHNIGALPTFTTFKNGTEQDRIIGGREADLENAIKRLNEENGGNGKETEEKPKNKKPKVSQKQPEVKEEADEDEEEVKKEVKRAPTSLKGGALLTFNSKNEIDSAINSGKSVVLDVEKTTCQFCQFVKVPMQKLAQKYPDILFAIVNKDEIQEIETQYQDKIKGYPTFLVFKDGELVNFFTGATGDEDKNLKILDSKIRAGLGLSAGRGEYTLKSKADMRQTKTSEEQEEEPVRKKIQKEAKKVRKQRARKSMRQKPVNESMPYCSVQI